MKKDKNKIIFFFASGLICMNIIFGIFSANAADTPDIVSRKAGSDPATDSPSYKGATADYLEGKPVNATGSTSTGGMTLPTGFGLPDPTDGIKGILVKIVNWLLAIVGLVALIAFIVSGLQYFFAAGDERSVETAKRNVGYSILGIIVALSGFVIVQAIDAILKATTNIF